LGETCPEALRGTTYVEKRNFTHDETFYPSKHTPESSSLMILFEYEPHISKDASQPANQPAKMPQSLSIKKTLRCVKLFCCTVISMFTISLYYENIFDVLKFLGWRIMVYVYRYTMPEPRCEIQKRRRAPLLQLLYSQLPRRLRTAFE
jgi:hypothetical protein